METVQDYTDGALMDVYEARTKHSQALENVFLYAGSEREIVQAGLVTCREMMANKISCSSFENGVAMKFLERHKWVRHPDVVGLFREYVEAGAIDVNGMLRCGDVVAVSGCEANNMVHPLEFSILKGTVDSFRKFLEAGADPDLVPTRDWMLTVDTRTRGSSPKDIYEVIAAKVRDPDQGQVMAAIVTEVMMSRRIQIPVGAPTAVKAPTPARRAGRTL